MKIQQVTNKYDKILESNTIFRTKESKLVTIEKLLLFHSLPLLRSINQSNVMHVNSLLCRLFLRSEDTPSPVTYDFHSNGTVHVVYQETTGLPLSIPIADVTFMTKNFKQTTNIQFSGVKT